MHFIFYDTARAHHDGTCTAARLPETRDTIIALVVYLVAALYYGQDVIRFKRFIITWYMVRTGAV